jgi:2-polyprenyl-3-methyl-5-hydroxy-6-metoxy-1,4-benzoquinol methylase
MDQPALDGEAHRLALKGLGRLNTVSNVSRMFWREISRRLMPVGGTPLRIVDVAAGGGDVCLGLWRRAQRDKISTRILALDISRTAVQYARRRCREAGEDICVREADVLHDPVPQHADVVMCSLFLHHLSESDTVTVLRKLTAARPRLLLLSDLRRSLAGYLLAQAACQILTRSPIVHFDGPQSVAASYTTEEIASLCRAAELDGFTVKRHWPQRMLLTWSS